MKVKCVWEHNGDDSILYASNFIGAFTRGKSKCEAIGKMSSEISAYLKWKGALTWDVPEPEIIQEKVSTLTISDADSDVLFDEEKKPLSMAEYEELKSLALKSARDFLTMYEAVPDKDKSVLPVRQTFYGEIPRSAYEMYEHTKNVNAKEALSESIRRIFLPFTGSRIRSSVASLAELKFPLIFLLSEKYSTSSLFSMALRNASSNMAVLIRPVFTSAPWRTAS